MTSLTKIGKSQLTIPASILLLGIYLLADFLLSVPSDTLNIVQPVYGLVANFISGLPFIWNSTVLAVITLLIAFVLLQIIDMFSLIREKSTLPFLFFLVISLQYIGANISLSVVFSVLFMSLSYLFLLHSYQLEKSQRAIFNYALFYSIATLFCIDLLWLLPLLFIALFFMRIFTVKNVAAILFGISAPYIIASFPYFIMDQSSRMWEIFSSLTHFSFPDFSVWTYAEMAHSLLTLTLVLITAASLKFGTTQDKVRVRSSYDFLLLTYFVLLAIAVFKGNALYPLHWSADFLAAYFIANYFTIKRGRLINYLFFIALLLYVLTGLLVL
ncbi:MAG: hypothetical protein ACRCX4_13410 [Bacteroidales bacterium]